RTALRSASVSRSGLGSARATAAMTALSARCVEDALFEVVEGGGEGMLGARGASDGAIGAARFEDAGDKRDGIPGPVVPGSLDGCEDTRCVVSGVPEPLADHRSGLPFCHPETDEGFLPVDPEGISRRSRRDSACIRT